MRGYLREKIIRHDSEDLSNRHFKALAEFNSDLTSAAISATDECIANIGHQVLAIACL